MAISFCFFFVFCHLSGSGSQGQLLEEGNPDTPPPSHFDQLLQGNTKRFPSQPRAYQSMTAFPWSALGSPPRWACPKHLPRETSRKHPDQMPEPPQLAPLSPATLRRKLIFLHPENPCLVLTCMAALLQY